jgi:hypothetical protein
MTTIEEAREAKQTLEDLKRKASALRGLEHEQAKNESLERLENLRGETQRSVYENVKKLEGLNIEFVQRLDELERQLHEAHAAMLQIRQLRRETLDLIERYGQTAAHHAHVYENADLYKDVPFVAMQAKSEIDINNHDFNFNWSPKGKQTPLRERILSVLNEG